MALERALRVTGNIGQWCALIVAGMAVVGMIGWTFKSDFLSGLGILGLPVIFGGILLIFVVLVVQKLVARRSRSGAALPKQGP